MIELSIFSFSSRPHSPPPLIFIGKAESYGMSESSIELPSTYLKKGTLTMLKMFYQHTVLLQQVYHKVVCSVRLCLIYLWMTYSTQSTLHICHHMSRISNSSMSHWRRCSRFRNGYCCYLDYQQRSTNKVIFVFIVNGGGSRMEIVVTCHSPIGTLAKRALFRDGVSTPASTPAIYSTSSSCSPDIWQCREALSGCCLLWSLVGSLRFLVRCRLPKPVSNFSLNVSVSRMSFHIPLSAGSILMVSS